MNSTRVKRSPEEIEAYYADFWRRVNSPTKQDNAEMARSMQECDDEMFAAIDAEEARLKSEEAQNKDS